MPRHAQLESDNKALIDRCRAGERQALEAVFRGTGPAVERVIRRLIGDSPDVEDLLQTTFAEAVVSFPRYRGDASVKTWLSRIAVNVVRQRWRRQGTRQRTQLQLVSDEPDVPPSLDSVASARRQLARVYEHLMKIAIKKRLAFALHVLDGRSIEEVAALTGASIAATRSRVFWARRALRAAARKDPLLSDWVENLEATE